MYIEVFSWCVFLFPLLPFGKEINPKLSIFYLYLLFFSPVFERKVGEVKGD